jgi:hypothetical protein
MPKRPKHEQLRLIEDEPTYRRGVRRRTLEHRRITEGETARLWWLAMTGRDAKLSRDAYTDAEEYLRQPLRRRA